MPSDPPSTDRIYEQPLNERVRAFLRLEHLFARAAHEIEGSEVWASRAALEAIIDVMAVMGRSDLKKELLKELERNSSTLESLMRNPNVDPERLSAVLKRVRAVLQTLHASENAPGSELKENELLAAVRQRASIPAGTCAFDLPSYHYWLQQPHDRRGRDLETWLGAFSAVRDGVSLSLMLLRESAAAARETAEGGFFQKTLETSTPCQLIRVAVASDLAGYPEISAGRHRFTVRFMQPGIGAGRPTQVGESIAFRLSCCGL